MTIIEHGPNRFNTAHVALDLAMQNLREMVQACSICLGRSVSWPFIYILTLSKYCLKRTT